MDASDFAAQGAGQQPPTFQQGPNGRRLHIAHRRSPSELTPLMLAHLGSGAEFNPANNNNAAQLNSAFMNLNLMPSANQLPTYTTYQQLPAHLATAVNHPQFSQQHLVVPMGPPTTTHHSLLNQQQSHRRNQSSVSTAGVMGSSQLGRENQPPRGGRGGGSSGAPAGAGHARRHSLALPEAKKAAELAEQKRKAGHSHVSSSTAADVSQSPTTPASALATHTPFSETDHPQDGLLSSIYSSAPAANARLSAHGRSQSVAVGNARGGGLAPRFQFPSDQFGGNSNNSADYGRRGSNQQHARTGSRNFEQNWRQPATDQQQMPQLPAFSSVQNNQSHHFQPGHRSRGSTSQQSISSSIGNFQYPHHNQQVYLPQQHMLVPTAVLQPGQALTATQIAQLQALNLNNMAFAQSVSQMQQPGQQQQHQLQQQQQQQQQQSQQQRKTLFTPYLPQATLPALINDGRLVAGILRVNKKNRSDAYVTTTDLDADIFICGSKDRNRALEGDLVAIELLDVDEVWSQKREKEEKKKRKDGSDGRGSTIAVNDATTQPESSNESGIRRRGSLRQRPTQKKNDDVEVEGQSLLLMEEEEINDEQKPLYAGHVVAVIERIGGQTFSGTLGLLRPSSQATKEKQEAERAAREGPHSRYQDRPTERPKIVWFKPTDKRVPLIAIPTEQAPKDFVERHQYYANKIFVACIKRWPITSLHPFGTLQETLGDMGELKVETDALLRDNNFGPDEFSDAVLRATGFDDWSVARDRESEEQDLIAADRRDYTSATIFTLSPQGVKETDTAVHIEQCDNKTFKVAVHIADVAHFVKASSLVDREARKRGTAVYLSNRIVPLLPSKLTHDILCFKPGEERYAVSVVFTVNENGQIDDSATWIGKSIVKSSHVLEWSEIDAVVKKQKSKFSDDDLKTLTTLHDIVQQWRKARYNATSSQQNISSLRLLYQLDDENAPPEDNIFNTSVAHEVVEELYCKVNEAVAKKLLEGFPTTAVLRRQASPNARRLTTFTNRMGGIGLDMDISSCGTLMNSLFKIEDANVRKGVETLLFKTMQRAKYFVAGRGSADHYAFNVPCYTHFTSPNRRYSDLLAHRQLDSILCGTKFTEEAESLSKVMEMCNTKKESAHFAQEQSVHIEACRRMDRKAQEIGGELIAEGIVICVYESAFDVLIPEWGFEKRVHCDQLPLKKAEFDKHKRLLELYWEKGVPSSAYVPEDERPKNQGHNSRGSTSWAPRRNRPDTDTTDDEAEARRQHVDINTRGTAEEDALFEDDDDDAGSETHGVSLHAHTHGTSVSPSRSGLPHLQKSDSKFSQQGDVVPESKLTNKEKYMSMFSLREEGGHHIQDVREMTRVPVILKTDLSKSPPCLTIRSVNPYAL